MNKKILKTTFAFLFISALCLIIFAGCSAINIDGRTFEYKNVETIWGVNFDEQDQIEKLNLLGFTDEEALINSYNNDYNNQKYAFNFDHTISLINGEETQTVAYWAQRGGEVLFYTDPNYTTLDTTFSNIYLTENIISMVEIIEEDVLSIQFNYILID